MKAGEVKRCSCCGVSHDAADWQGLQFVGVQRFDGYDDIQPLELRNCACGSTLAVQLPKQAA